MVDYNFGAPKIDFSLLANLGNTFDKSRENQAKFDMNAQRQKTLADLGGGGNLEALGTALMKAGDLEGGATALRLAEAQKNRSADVSYRDRRAAAEDAERAAAREDRRIGQRTYGETGQDDYGNPQYGWRDPYAAQPKTMPQIAVPAPAAPAPSADLPAPGAAENQFVIPSTGATVGGGPAVGGGAAPPVIPGAPVAPILPRTNVADPLEPDTAPFVRKPPPNTNKKEWVTFETKRLQKLRGLDEEGAPVKLTEEQGKGRIYGGMMEGAEKEYRPNENASYSVGQRVLDNLLPGKSSNFLTSESYQSATNAKKEWIAALLRKTSGATILPSEFDMYNDIYFPQVGESKAIAEQKARARERALQGVKAGLPPEAIVQMERGQTPLEAAPGKAGETVVQPKTTPGGFRYKPL